MPPHACVLFLCMHFGEDFLHYIWKFKLFDHTSLCTTAGEDLAIHQYGLQNNDAGPDFSNARISLSGIEWAGNIEIHISASDWFLHAHQHDAAYSNVILHVVYEHDRDICLEEGGELPVLVLKDRISSALFENYERLITAPDSFPCAAQLRDASPLARNTQLTRCLLERLLHRSEIIYERLAMLKGNWEETFYHFMAKSFGFKVNSTPFEQLAISLPGNILARHADKPLQVAALIFGQAGFLQQPFAEAYPAQLRHEYLFLKKKYGLWPCSLAAWKFMRMRPQNFPTVRLAQFAALVSSRGHTLSVILSAARMDELKCIFEDLPVHPYWRTHYHFKKETKIVHTTMGEAAVNGMLINTIALFLFAYGRHLADDELINRAITLLEQLPAERNALTRRYAGAGMEVDSAFQSQAILQLNKNYCNAKKCLNCAIGTHLLKI